MFHIRFDKGLGQKILLTIGRIGYDGCFKSDERLVLKWVVFSGEPIVRSKVAET